MDDRKEIAKQLGRNGGNKTKERYGSAFYQQIGNKSAAIRRERLWKAKEKGTHTRKEWEDLKAEFGNKCVRCRSNKYHVTKDHIVAIYRGGSDAITNLQPLCRRCNSMKGGEDINWVKIRRRERKLKLR